MCQMIEYGVLSCISKIKLVGYHQWRVLIGWATTSKSVNKQNGCWIAFCRRPQLYSVKPNWLPVSRHWDFPQISEEQESWRTWRRKIVQTQRRSDQAQKVGRCCSAALEASGPNWTVKPLVFFTSHWRFILLALVFFKFVWERPLQLLWRFVVVDCTSEEQSRTKQQTAVTGWFGSHWTVEWLFK